MAMPMPGSFQWSADEVPCFHQPNARSAFFIPPSGSPAPTDSTSSHSYTTWPSSTLTTSVATRKRPRLDTFCQGTRLPHGPRPRGENDEPPSPVPLVNTDYRIAGGLDTPRVEQIGTVDANDWELGLELRVNRFTQQQPSPTSDSSFPHTPPQHSGEEGRATAPSNTGWGSTLWNLTGGMAGKLINFCWTTAFHGFHAGGGQGYSMHLDIPTVTKAKTNWPEATDDVFDPGFCGHGSTPIPGEFPGDHSFPDYKTQIALRQAAETPLPAGNNPGGSSLRTNWVVVGSPSHRRSESMSPVRKKARSSASSTTTHLPSTRPVTRPSLNTRPRKPTQTPTAGASYASPRSSPKSRAPATYAPPSPSFRPTASDYHGGAQHRPSYASPRRPSNQRVTTDSSPKSPDVLKLEKKLRNAGQRQSDSIKRMNERMQLLLREGQQALATKIEVSDPIDDDDEGYGDGDCDYDDDFLEPAVTVPPNPQTHVW